MKARSHSHQSRAGRRGQRDGGELLGFGALGRGCVREVFMAISGAGGEELGELRMGWSGSVVTKCLQSCWSIWTRSCKLCETLKGFNRAETGAICVLDQSVSTVSIVSQTWENQLDL